jgi:hypothetical protein
MSPADKPNQTSKKAAGRPPSEKQNRISELERGHAHAGDAAEAAAGASASSSAPAPASNPASIQPPRSDAINPNIPPPHSETPPEAGAPLRPGDDLPPPLPERADHMPPKPARPSSKQQNTGMRELVQPDNTIMPNTARADTRTERTGRGPFFAQERARPERGPARDSPGTNPSGDPAATTTRNSNLTSHINDPAMRRAPPGSTAREAEGGVHSDVSPLARDGATPAHEDARRAQDAHDADQRARLKGLTPREDVQGWHQAEGERQSDLPGRPRKI